MIEIIVMALCLALSAFFSGTESAFTSLSPSQIEGLRNQRGRRSQQAVKLAIQPQLVLTTTLIGNNLMNIIISVLASSLTLQQFGNSFLGITTGILTYLILIFGEVVPKHIAVTHNERWVRWASQAVGITSLLLRPVFWLVQGTLWFMGISLSKQEHRSRNINLLHAINVARKSGSVGRQKFRLLHNLLHFDKENVESIITHRTKLFSLPEEMAVQEALEQMSRRGFSRAPLYRGGEKEHIVGIVLLKELLQISQKSEPKRNLPVGQVMYRPIFVPLSRNLDQLFTQLSRAHQRMAIVLDDFGGVAGVVTLEDIFEKIFGELYDENEQMEEYITPVGHHAFRIRASIPIALLNEQLSLNLPQGRGMKTLSGYIIHQYSGVPERGTTIDTPYGSLKVLQAREGRIDEVQFRRYHPTPVTK